MVTKGKLSTFVAKCFLSFIFIGQDVKILTSSQPIQNKINIHFYFIKKYYNLVRNTFVNVLYLGNKKKKKGQGVFLYVVFPTDEKCFNCFVI